MPKILTSPPKYFCLALCVLSTSFPPAEATIHHSNCRLSPPPTAIHQLCLIPATLGGHSSAASYPGHAGRRFISCVLSRPRWAAIHQLRLIPATLGGDSSAASYPGHAGWRFISCVSQHESPSRNKTCSSDSCGHCASSFSWKGFPVFPRYEGFCSANPAIQPAK
jgi:hypothetical protein